MTLQVSGCEGKASMVGNPKFEIRNPKADSGKWKADRRLRSRVAWGVTVLVMGLLAGAFGCGEAPTSTTQPAPMSAVTPDSAAVPVAAVDSPTDVPQPLPETAATPALLTSPEAEQAFAALVAPETTPENWERAQTRLLELGEAAVPTLSRELTSDDAFRREVAASALAMLGPDAASATVPLRRALTDESVHVRANAATALCAIPEQAEVVIPVLTDLLHDADPQVRQMSAVNLSNFGIEAAPFVPQLALALESAPNDVLVQVVELLGRIGPDAESAAPRLQQIAFQQDGEVKAAATAALERIAEKPGVP